MIILSGGMLVDLDQVLFVPDRRRSRLRFKYAHRQCNQNEKSIRADQYSKSLMNKDMTSFWDSIRKSSNTRIPLASMVECESRQDTSHGISSAEQRGQEVVTSIMEWSGPGEH